MPSKASEVMSAHSQAGRRSTRAVGDRLNTGRGQWLLAVCLGLVGLALALGVLGPHARHLGIDYSVEVSGQVIQAGPRPQLAPFQYRYLFQGDLYYGTGVRVTGGTRQALDRYRSGDRIPVHLDPARPERALIEPGLVAADRWQLGWACGLVLVAWWLVRRQFSS
ncbi:MAG: hypothetical protein ACLFSC_11335 [Wenzhouxiangella sp.]